MQVTLGEAGAFAPYDLVPENLAMATRPAPIPMTHYPKHLPKVSKLFQHSRGVPALLGARAMQHRERPFRNSVTADFVVSRALLRRGRL